MNFYLAYRATRTHSANAPELPSVEEKRQRVTVASFELDLEGNLFDL